MKRHEALQDLSRDHFFALRCALEIRQGAEAGGAGLQKAADSVLELWEADLQHHFREEEELLLPLLGRHGAVTGHPEVCQMLDDHAWLRDRIREVDRLRQGGADFGPLLEEVGRRLHDHARFEEREVFPLLERTLTDEELAEFLQASLESRLRHRGPGAAGPHRPEPGAG